MNLPRVLVTGANGFVGQALCPLLEKAGWEVRRATRSAAAASNPAANSFAVGGINAQTDWRKPLEGISAVVHLAARVHLMQDDARDPLAQYRAVNRDGTENLARQAAEAGVRRLVYLSSIKVNGERTTEQPFRADDAPHPQDSYARSKWEAEQALQRVAAATGLESVILRPPLVYGPGVKANFLRLMRLAERGIPLPLGMLDNRRSLLYLGNLADAVRMCLTHPAAAGKTFLLSDGASLSTPALIRALAAALGKPARLLPVAPRLLRLAGRLTGKDTEIARLLDSLEIDGTPIERELDWQPPHSLEEGLGATAAWFRNSSPERA